MPKHDIMVIGGSAGSLEPVGEIVSLLPQHLPAALFIVLHSSPGSAGMLAQIMQRRSALKIQQAQDGEPVQHGHIYTAPPDHHLLVHRDRVVVVHGPKENGFRPAIDPLFRTAAAAYGPRVVGVVLSGALDDGTYGLTLIKRAGGIALVQHPEEACIPAMPLSAIQNVAVDEILRAEQIGARLIELAETPVRAGALSMSKQHGNGNGDDPTEPGPDALKTGELPGPPTAFTCPECGGALWELMEGNVFHYRCHVGHGFSSETLLSQKSEHLEGALWSALRALEESAALQRRLAQRAAGRGLSVIAEGHA